MDRYFKCKSSDYTYFKKGKIYSEYSIRMLCPRSDVVLEYPNDWKEVKVPTKPIDDEIIECLSMALDYNIEPSYKRKINKLVKAIKIWGEINK